MRLLHLTTRDFRNLAPLDLDTDARFVVLHGANAQGKTNTLEAIYLLATLKPLRAKRNRDLVRWGATACGIAGDVAHDGLVRRYRIDLSDGQRRVTLDAKPPADLAAWFEGIRAIAFTPQDGAIVRQEPKLRRRWLDRAAFTARPVHLDVVQAYRRTLSHKSAALRHARVDATLLDVLDDQLAVAGAELVRRRVDTLAELEPHARAVHGDISGGTRALRLRYRTEATGDDDGARRSALRARLAEVRDEEVRRGRTLAGPQTDEVRIELDGRSARTYGSQGQVRTVVLALKLGELLAARARGDTPLFLLDDVSSELDAARTAHLVGVLEEAGVQVFATTTEPGHLSALPMADTLTVTVDAGALTRSEHRSTPI